MFALAQPASHSMCSARRCSPPRLPLASPPLLHCPLGFSVARIALVKPDKARAIEMRLLQMAQGGMFQAKVDEKKLISMLEQIDEASSAARTKITVSGIGRYCGVPVCRAVRSTPGCLHSCTAAAHGLVLRRWRVD